MSAGFPHVMRTAMLNIINRTVDVTQTPMLERYQGTDLSVVHVRQLSLPLRAVTESVLDQPGDLPGRVRALAVATGNPADRLTTAIAGLCFSDELIRLGHKSPTQASH